MARATEASTPQSVWLEQLADVDCDWDSISLPSTPTHGKVAMSSSTEDAAPRPHGFVKAEPRSDSPSPTEDDLFSDTADLEDFFCKTKGSDFSSTAGTPALTAPSDVSSSPPDSSSSTVPASGIPRRIIRSTFPEAVKSNSPIPGLTSSLRIRTSFCLGEALNIGCQASREDQNILLEFYCRVMSSYREDNTQHFVLADLTHDNPPFINATFAS
ncbi:hypothetical protein D6D05_03228 [Aureobasidium pullulans]|nr:hypothetical protein D6D05_03228 [Aureobasidium pullulans]